MILDPKEICVLVLYDDYYAELAEITINKNIKQYCDLHGYTLISHKIENIDNGRSPQWQKIQVSIDVLKTNQFKWLFFLDTDCLIMNSTSSIDLPIKSGIIMVRPPKPCITNKSIILPLGIRSPAAIGCPSN